jgi:Flp pilus assembly protein TadD
MSTRSRQKRAKLRELRGTDEGFESRSGFPVPAVEPQAASAKLNGKTDELLQAKALHRAGRLAEARRIYKRVLIDEPENADALHFLGLLSFQLGHSAAAVDLMYRALALCPDSPDYHCNLGMVLVKSGQVVEALEVLERALELQPDYPEALDNLALVLEKQGKIGEAIAAWERSLTLKEDLVPALIHVGRAYHLQERYDDGLRVLRRAVELSPRNPEGQGYLGCVLRKTGELEQAAVAFRIATQLDPASAEQHSNLGTALFELGDPQQSLAHLEKAVELKPDYIDGHWNLSLTLLALNDWQRGWLEYEWRRHSHQKKGLTRNYPQPEWNGCDISGRTLLVTTEQGLGDCLQFCRYAPLLAERGAKVIFEAPPQLCEILRGLKGVDCLVAYGEPPPKFDAHVQMMSLPGILGTRIGNVPVEVPYLHADPKREAIWKPKLAGPGFKVGIAWQGSLTFGNDRFRSIPLRQFEPLAGIDGVRLFSLQKNFGAEQLDQLAGTFTVEQFDPPLDEGGTGAFMDTAAVMNHLDLIVTSDTSIAHLAGALGVRVWVALGYGCDWRWLRERDDSPWYPTMRLFRQTTAGDWVGVFSRIAKALRDTGNAVPADEARSVLAPVAPGELMDRLSILHIKAQRVTDPLKLKVVRTELEALTRVRDEALPHGDQLEELARQLRSVNETLWQIEDDIRAADAAGEFGPRFIELSRSIYRTNDRRAELKQQINLLLGSKIREEKQYERY